MNRRIGIRTATLIGGSLSVLLGASTTADPLNPVKTKAEMVSSAGNTTRFWESQRPFSDEALAALTVYLEARGESFAGKLAVAAVIRNRMERRYQSDGTIAGTVLRPRQFQPWNSKRPHQVQFDFKNKSMRDSLLAWKLVQDGRKVVDGALLFYNPNLVRAPYWATVSQKVATIGSHHFYIPTRGEI